METYEEEVTLEQLTYLIVEKVGPHVLISYNILRDKLKPDSDLYYKFNTATITPTPEKFEKHNRESNNEEIK